MLLTWELSGFFGFLSENEGQICFPESILYTRVCAVKGRSPGHRAIFGQVVNLTRVQEVLELAEDPGQGTKQGYFSNKRKCK